MKVNVRMKNLPKEFDFKSNINPYGLIYHAKEMEDMYVVSTDKCSWNFNKQHFHNCFVRKDFVVCDKNDGVGGRHK